MENYSYKERGRKEVLDRNMSMVRKIELAKTKERIKAAKDDVAQSGLTVRPLINELEKLKSNLNAMNSRITMSNAIIVEFKTELETARNFIRFKKEMESKLRLKINELNQAMDRTGEEMEQLVHERDKQRRIRTELQQALRLKKQSLKTLQLTLRAIRLESEAIGAPMTQAVRHIHCSETDTTTVELPHEEYYKLMIRANEETLLVDWRVSVSLEQKLVAEASRDSASRRLKEISKTKLMERANNEQKGEDLFTIEDVEEEKSRVKSEIEVIDEEATQAKLIPWSSKESSPPLNRRLRRIKRSVQIKKPSALVRIRSCLIQKLIILLR